MEMKRFIPSPCRTSRFVNAFPSLLLGFFLISGTAFAHSSSPAKPEKDHGHHGGNHQSHGEGGMIMRDGKQYRRGAGETVYKHMCVFCHGADGNGGGRATSYLYPWPRDFRKGIYKHRSTPSGSLPVDEDIYQTIMKGVPGTAMPAWKSALSEEEAWSVIEYIKKFSPRFENEKPKEPIKINQVPPTTTEASAHGKKLYEELRCQRCHGTDLKGEGPMASDLFDIWDHRAFVYDLTNPNTYKWGFNKKEIFMTLSTGVDGTPMKSYHHLTESERWDLAAFVESKVKKDTFQPAEYEIDLNVKKITSELDDEPENTIWNDVPINEVKLVPLNARRDPINRVQLQSLMNDEDIAFRVSWDDPVPNHTSSRHQDFKDAIALEFALGSVTLHTHGHNEPFFGMGNRGKPVNIWQWRADWQKEIETKKALEYATDEHMDMDVMIFGGEVNPVDSLSPFREVPIEELNAEGFGTLTPQPKTKQNITGKGVYKDGKWTVVFRRTLDSLNKWDVKFTSGHPILMGFAVWDGKLQDRNGRKTISMWQRLNLP